ncbi:hypothetical protein AVEN_178547-1 [Araneus ventricosus]|uniref:Uncharacterized protein n=1 Tax=Araneus ventricosus TaxID=182803 RepID=A0A4Y2HHK1_ARAVE|nr:hypothetical protein AVEN_178547-1 [Araneus ventricosus]
MSSIFQRRDSTVCAIKSYSTTSISLFCDLNESGSAGPLPLTSAPLEPHQWPSAEALRTGRRSALLEKVALRRAGCAGFSWFPRASHECGPVSPQSPSRHSEYLGPHFLPNYLLKHQVSLVKYRNFHISAFYSQLQIVTYLAKFAGVR